MSNIVELTQVMTKGNRVERISGRLASKVRFTEPTLASFRHNDISKSVQRYNDKYTELRNAVVSAEVAAAENEARSSLAQADIKAQADEKQRLALIKEDEQVAKIAGVGVAKNRMSSLSIDALKLAGNFGTLGKNFGVNVKSKYLPKALSVPKLYSKVYKTISRSIDLYKLADKSDVVDQYLIDSGIVDGQLPAKVPGWRKVFENSGISNAADVTVAMNSQPSRETEETEEFVAPVEKGVSPADYSHRSLLAQINDELVDLRKLRSSPNGFSSPFDSGLEEREDNLLSMLKSISGIDTMLIKKKPSFERKNTDFQNVIEEIVGYSKPLTEEEYSQKAAAEEEYYSRPEVGEKIDELRHKDILSTFNEQESYDRVMEAERKDNERSAQEAMALDVIDEESMDLADDDVQDTILTLGAMDQARQIKEAIDENKLLAAGSVDEAKRLVAEDERNKIIFGSKEQAQQILDAEERQLVIEGSLEQAQMLKTLNDFMKKQAEMQKQDAEETAMIVEGSKEQAQQILDAEERQFVIDGSVSQAANIKNAENTAAIIKGSEEQAKELVAVDERNRIIAGSMEQAKNIIAQAEKTAQAQNVADSIIDINDPSGSMEDLVKQMAYHSVSSDDLLLGAAEQAKEIVAAEETARIVEGSKEQAQNLFGKVKNQEVYIGAREQAQSIIAAEDAKRAIKGAKDQALALVDAEDKKMVVTGAVVQAQNIVNDIETRKIKRGAQEQAQSIVAAEEKQFVVNGSVEQAKQLFSSKKTTTSNNVVQLNNGTNSILQAMNCTPVETDARFCSIYAPSRPIRLRPNQKENLSLRTTSGSQKTTSSNVKEMLTALRDQLEESPEFDFLRYSDNTVSMSKAA